MGRAIARNKDWNNRRTRFLGQDMGWGYLKATLTAIANGHPQNHIDDLLPWNFKLSS